MKAFLQFICLCALKTLFVLLAFPAALPAASATDHPCPCSFVRSAELPDYTPATNPLARDGTSPMATSTQYGCLTPPAATNSAAPGTRSIRFTLDR